MACAAFRLMLSISGWFINQIKRDVAHGRPKFCPAELSVQALVARAISILPQSLSRLAFARPGLAFGAGHECRDLDPILASPDHRRRAGGAPERQFAYRPCEL